MLTRVLGSLLGIAASLTCPSASAQGMLARDPEAARLVFDDLPRFWSAWDAAQTASAESDRIAIFQARYLSPGTPGLAAFTRERIGSAKQLVATMAAHPRYYAGLRGQTEAVHAAAPAIRAALRNFAARYPDAVFPDIYFVIGRMSSGGTISPAGLLIGIEMYGLRDDTEREELGNWHLAVLKPMEQLPHIVAHELVHSQQRYPDEATTLLSGSITEGVADFVAELTSGAHINPHVHAWAAPREAELWRAFRPIMHGSDLTGWLYDTAPGGGRPADLGYYVGYRIAKAYYDRAADKREALRSMLVIEDFDAFLAASGYGEAMDAQTPRSRPDAGPAAPGPTRDAPAAGFRVAERQEADPAPHRSMRATR